MRPTPPPTDFAGLGALHRELEELFLQHQEALISLDLPRAREGLERYLELLRMHMAAEEELLLPELPRAGRIRGASLELFTGEHQRMRELLARCREGLHALRPEDPGVRRSVLLLLDTQGTYKHLEHHHSLREETFLFPALDQVLSAEERRALLAAFYARIS
jgi:hemerythrin-like domain-containing protein